MMNSLKLLEKAILLRKEIDKETGGDIQHLTVEITNIAHDFLEMIKIISKAKKIRGY